MRMEREREMAHFLTFFVLKRLFLVPLRIKHFKLKRKSCNLFFLSHKYSFDRDTVPLKVPKCEIFDRSDFPDFYTIKSRREGDFGVKIKKF